jgi:hypothetical protein
MTLHIFRKDAKRLWPAIAVSLAVLATLARQDRWRSDFLPGAVEGYLNLLVPVIWAALLGLAVELDAIAGETQFWITRPFRRGALIGAKLLFAGLFVHLPAFLADCYILSARGFSPPRYLWPLLSKQLVLAGTLTLPSLALASLVRSFAHFMLEMVGVAALVLVLSSALGTTQLFYLWPPFPAVRGQAVVTVVALASAVILYLQYGSRRIAASRVVAAGAATGAALLFSFFLPSTAVAVRAAARPVQARLALQLDPTRPYGHGFGRDVAVQLPISLTGLPEGTHAEMVGMWSEISATGGPSYRERMPTSLPSSESRPYRLSIINGRLVDQSPESILLQFAHSTYEALAYWPLTLRGEAAVRLFHREPAVGMVIGETRDVEGVGRCTTSMATVRLEEQMVKLECESPLRSPYRTRAALVTPGWLVNWTHALGDARSATPGPVLTWLSPLYRDNTYWQLAENPIGPGSRWLVPLRWAPGARIEITPERDAGYASLRYEFRDLNLRQNLQGR